MVHTLRASEIVLLRHACSITGINRSGNVAIKISLKNLSIKWQIYFKEHGMVAF